MKRNEFKIEICSNGVASCRAAQEAEADRVELCAGIPEGGTTPSAGTIALTRRLLTTTRLQVIIRPRGGDFLYTDEEQQVMAEDIRMARRLGADGVVFGCLTADGDIDLPACERLMREAEGLDVTFHRAFDRCREPLRALEELIGLGVGRVLTSGQQPTAEAGIGLLRELNDHAQGRIRVLAGCGINESNIARIARETGVREFHCSVREPFRSAMRHYNPAVCMGTPGLDEDIQMLTTRRRVSATIAALETNETF